MTNIGGGRILRVCDLCGGVDTGPRHVLVGGLPGVFTRPGPEVIDRVVELAPPEHRARLLAELMDTGSSDRHMPCCRAAGCPDGSCDMVTAGAEDLRDDELLEHLIAGDRS